MSLNNQYKKDDIGKDNNVVDVNLKLLGLGANINPFISQSSASRSVMSSSFLTQMLVILGATPRRIVAGTELQYGKYTMNVDIPEDSRVVDIIHKYPPVYGLDRFKLNPETILVLEHVNSKKLDCVSIPHFHWQHKVFGFEYKKSRFYKNIVKGTMLQAGSIIEDSPNVVYDREGKRLNYNFGIDTKVAFMSVPGIIEDGIVASKSWTERCATKGYAQKVLTIGQDCIPLNLYGNDTDYRCFPEIGEKVREDGVLFAVRDYDPVLAICNMSARSLKTIRHDYDRVTYIPLSSVNNDYPATVQDINIWRTHNPDLHRTPHSVETQLKRYHNASKVFHSSIIKSYTQEQARRRTQHVETTYPFHRLLVEAMINDNNESIKPAIPKGMARAFRRDKLDGWRVEITVGWTIIPVNGFKATDLHGGKGVITAVWDDERMPVDDFGNRADIIVDGSSTIRRTNFGRFNEHYISASIMHIERQIKDFVKQNDYVSAVKLYFDFIQIASPLMYEKAIQVLDTPEKQRHEIDYLCQNGFQLWLPPNSPNIGGECIRQLNERFPVPKTPVTYIDDVGKVRRTRKPVLIGSLYMVLLEKIGDDWGATSLPKRQHHGIPGKLTEADKSSLPWRDQAFKIFGESEVRLLMGTTSPEFVAVLVSLANSPAACMDIAHRILTTANPTDIQSIIDYVKHSKIPSRAAEYCRHILEVSGIQIMKGES